MTRIYFHQIFHLKSVFGRCFRAHHCWQLQLRMRAMHRKQMACSWEVGWRCGDVTTSLTENDCPKRHHLNHLMTIGKRWLLSVDRDAPFNAYTTCLMMGAVNVHISPISRTILIGFRQFREENDRPCCEPSWALVDSCKRCDIPVLLELWLMKFEVWLTDPQRRMDASNGGFCE